MTRLKKPADTAPAADAPAAQPAHGGSWLRREDDTLELIETTKPVIIGYDPGTDLSEPVAQGDPAEEL